MNYTPDIGRGPVKCSVNIRHRRHGINELPNKLLRSVRSDYVRFLSAWARRGVAIRYVSKAKLNDMGPSSMEMSGRVVGAVAGCDVGMRLKSNSTLKRSSLRSS